MSVIVVGAGLAGLTCARKLLGLGEDVVVLEASDGVGGRVRSDKVGGFTLDRGFQVLFDSYPAVRRNVDIEALKLSFFPSGAVVCRDGKRTTVCDPRRAFDFAGLIETLFTSAIPYADKFRLLNMGNRLSKEEGQDAAFSDQTIEQYLLAEGFSSETIDFFFRPFYGGVLLDRGLNASAGLFRYYFAMLNNGHASLPSAGIGALTEQLSRPLFAKGAVKLGSNVASLITQGGKVVGVVLDDATEIFADSVVLAVDAPAAAAIAGISIPISGVGVTAVYFSGTAPVWKSPYLLLNANKDVVVNNAQMLSNVAPSYAPAGKCLLGVTILGVGEATDEDLSKAVLAELKELFTGDSAALSAIDGYKRLAVYRIRYAQPSQPPGQKLPHLPHVPGLLYAGDWTASGSINGAMLSGERAARAVVSK